MTGAPAVPALAETWELAASVPDPELPMLTIGELGVLRAVDVTPGGVSVTLTPTYSGCPALPEITRDVRVRLTRAGCGEVTVRTVLSPPWSSDWVTPAGRAKLAAAGIAPPHAAPAGGPVPLTLTSTRGAVDCPRCASARTQEISRFGATACTALYRCVQCGEPFPYLKEI